MILQESILFQHVKAKLGNDPDWPEIAENLDYVINHHVHRGKFRDLPNLNDAFIWIDAPQGHMYWFNIYQRTVAI